MAELKLIYNCDHNVLNREFLIRTITMQRNADTAIDKIHDIDSNGKVTQIINVSAVNYIKTIDESVTISPEIYNFYNNSIVWTRAFIPGVTGIYRVPAAGEKYLVNIKYAELTFIKYNSEDCPRCGGNNWYISPVQEGDTVKEVTGPYLVAQEFVKCLLTVPKTDRIDETYGSGLLMETGVPYLDDELTTFIRTAVNVAERQCIDKQLNSPNRGLDELLEKAIITSIDVDESSSGIYLYITLITMAGRQVNINFKV